MSILQLSSSSHFTPTHNHMWGSEHHCCCQSGLLSNNRLRAGGLLLPELHHSSGSGALQHPTWCEAVCLRPPGTISVLTNAHTVTECANFWRISLPLCNSGPAEQLPWSEGRNWCSQTLLISNQCLPFGILHVG